MLLALLDNRDLLDKIEINELVKIAEAHETFVLGLLHQAKILEKLGRESVISKNVTFVDRLGHGLIRSYSNEERPYKEDLKGLVYIAENLSAFCKSNFQ